MRHEVALGMRIGGSIGGVTMGASGVGGAIGSGARLASANNATASIKSRRESMVSMLTKNHPKVDPRPERIWLCMSTTSRLLLSTTNRFGILLSDRFSGSMGYEERTG